MPTARRGARKTTGRKSEDEEPVSMEVDAVDVHIEDLSSFTKSKNLIVYGPSGHGKTVLVGGAPNATFLSTETGVVAAQRAGHQAGLIYTPSWEHVVAGIDLAEKKLGPEDWLIVDSATKMQQLLIRWILKVNHQRNSSRDLDIPAIKDHQKWQNAFARFIARIIDAEFNSIIVATSMMKVDEEGEDIILPNIVGKDYAMAMNFCAEADMVLYYAVSKTASTEKKTVRRILAQPFPPYVAKDRYNCLGKRFDVQEGEYDAMAEIIDLIDASSISE
jgi:hypothetical protein